MYRLNKEKKEYVPYNQRYRLIDNIKDLITCKTNGYKTVVYIVPNVYNQSIRYRVDHVLDVIEQSDEWYGFSIQIRNIDILSDYLTYIDLVIFHRIGISQVNDFLTNLKANKIITAFDVDDLVFSVDKAKEAAIATKTNIEQRIWQAKEYYLLMDKVDCIITSTAYLLEEIRRCGFSKIYVIRNFLNQIETELADCYLNQKNKGIINCKKIILGYFCGSTGHDRDFRVISDSIEKIMYKYSNVYLKIVGFLNIPDNLRVFGDRVIEKSFMDGNSLLYEVAEIDINLIPLDDNDFTRARSEIKFFDASAVGTYTIASPLPIYKNIERAGKKIILSSNDEWEKRISELIEILYYSRDNCTLTSDVEEYKFYGQEDVISYIFDEIIKNGRF